MADLGQGPQAWRQKSNHNRMIDFESMPADRKDPSLPGKVEVAYFGSSAFRITSPLGLTLMVDPWRNLPTRSWDWYFRDFPLVEVDIGVSSHAHFDHDALHRLDAHVLLDRPIGSWQFADMCITAIADKHATDSSAALYDFCSIIHDFNGIDITPPDNPRSWDHCLLLIETGGLRLLQWGDNRHNPPEDIWQRIGQVDILFLPVDQSRHVLSYDSCDAIIKRLNPHVIVPHHYYIRDLTLRSSTLLPADEWVESRSHQRLSEPVNTYTRDSLGSRNGEVHFFADLVAFDKTRWRNGELDTGNLQP